MKKETAQATVRSVGNVHAFLVYFCAHNREAKNARERKEIIRLAK